MNKFNFTYRLRLAHLVLSHSDNLSSTLQNPNLCASDAQTTANLVVQTLKNLRNDTNAEEFLKSSKVHSAHLKVDIPEARINHEKEKNPRNLEDFEGYGSDTSPSLY